MDKNTYDISEQFLVGPAFLVTPVLVKGSVEVDGYFPKDYWYDYYNGSLIKSENEKNGTEVTLDAPIDHIPLHVRGGFILPTQQKANTTFFSRQNPFGLIFAPNEDGEAEGDLYYDDGLTQNFDAQHYFSTFKLRDNKLQMNVEHNTYDEMVKLKLDKVRIFRDYWSSIDPQSLTFYVNKQKLDKNQIQIEAHEIILTQLSLSMTVNFEIEWSTDDDLFESIDIEVDENDQIITGTSAPVIDCSIQNSSITEADCIAKGCQFNAGHKTAPKCFIPKNVGGYYLVNQTAEDEEYYLRKDDSFSLIREEIQLIHFKVTHGNIRDSSSRLTRIKISDPNDPNRYQVPIELNFDESAEQHLSVNVIQAENETLDQPRFAFDVRNKHGQIM